MRNGLIAAYGVGLVIWTWLLLKPEPVPEWIIGGMASFEFDQQMLEFLLAKTLHFSMYTFLAVAGGYLARTRPQQIAIWVGLILHGIGSEIGQLIGNTYFQTNRHGCIRDMLIDTAGIGVGAWLWRKRQNRVASRS